MFFRARSLVLSLFCAALVGLSGFSAYLAVQRFGIAELQATGLHRLDLYAASLEREIGKYAFLPGTLSLEQEVLDLLAGPAGGEAAKRVNVHLEKLNARAGTLSIYVIDAHGRVLAASNWRQADSFVGEDLSFRPYFRDAMASGTGRFFGIGTTRGDPGYYLAARLAGSEGDEGVLGVAVVKVSLEQLEKSWSTVEAPVLVADENGVVILSAVAGWKFTLLRSLDERMRAAFDHTQQYNRRALQPLGMREIAAYGHDARLVRIVGDDAEAVSVYPVSGRFLAQSRAMADTRWTLTVLSQLEQVDSLAQSRAALAAIAAACLCLLAAVVAERRRHLRHRLAARETLQKAYDELEHKVEARTADLSAANHKLQDEISERIRAERTLRAAQEELIQAGKLAVIGQLSTGIAHELNQPLAALRTLSANAGRFLERGDADTARANLARIAELADRMGRITGQLRSFARKSNGLSEPVRLGQALDNVLALLEARLRRSATVVERHGPREEAVVSCDPNRLEQVLVNLVGNALDAMAGQPRPRIELDWDCADGAVRLQIRDHGPGLSDEACSHLFEPFFTTKQAGDGLGLGLAISAGIVRDSGGSLQGANHPDGGAVFTLELPLAHCHD
ncbi:sensor histidine kinase [Thauera linaloolentis]|uniref:C4-dicarboxylate transport sensor protein DctB n=1 Tax=Thauera linaloolentis (strain DSM 12138 / JCM 21573 / CCUG 41526 / CIP 105981 / IAM 15112 / NBRC 102519 / 47Lol) TaxID=1123367 RepID=N6Z7X1_THAL4|nr:ATP-binding protein [Thauera linaloolentis]ENO90393.1 histidine kinase [Thauera linaloolentis 47Lol = DSM 12138]MCM8564032.1 ATP-binding protein [Thauera linaloolentis]